MAEEQTLHSKSDDVTTEAPQITTTITRTPDGRWQSILSVSFQVSSTWGPADNSNVPATQRKPSGGDTETGGTTKTGLGLQKRSSRVASRGSDGDNDPGGSSKGGLGLQKRAGT